MAPSSIAEVQAHEESHPQVTSPAPRSVPLPPRSTVERGPARARALLNEAFLESHRFKSSSKTLHPLVSSFIHLVIVGGPILAGLYYTDTLDLKEFTTTLLVAPPPPRPPPPAPAAGVVKAQTPKRVFMNGGKLLAPIVILKQIAEIKEAALEPTRTRTTPWTVWLCQSCSSMERRAHNRNVSIKFPTQLVAGSKRCARR